MSKKVLSLLLTLTLILGVLPLSAFAEDGNSSVSGEATATAATTATPSSTAAPMRAAPRTSASFAGAGTSIDPYLITTSAQLAELATLVNAATSPYADAEMHYQLEDDINLGIAPYNTGTGWTPIGTVTNPFKGTFDGNDKIISGLTINEPDTSENKGLFASVTGGTIKNLGLTNVSVAGNGNVGGLVGVLYNGTGLVSKCYVTGTVSGNNYVGGLVGSNSSSGGVGENCYSTATVTGTGTTPNTIGGVVGGNNTGNSVKNCYATGVISGYGMVGGVVGGNGGTVKNCVALNSSVTATLNPSVAGRVVGITGGTYSGLFGLTTISGTWSNKDIAGKDGGDISDATAKSVAFWNSPVLWDATAQWDTTVWNIKAGQYPNFDVRTYDYTLYYNSSDNKLHKDSLTGEEYTPTTGSYTGSGATLTLNGISFDTSAETALVVPYGTTITLAKDSENTLIASNRGIYSNDGPLTFGGTGSLTVKSDNVGIYADGNTNLTIKNGTITVNAVTAIKSEGNITINNGTINAIGADYGLAGYLKFNGGTVTAIGKRMSAINAAPALPATYTCWINTTDNDPGGAGSSSYVHIPSTYKYFKVVAAGLDDSADSDDSDGDDEDVGGNNNNNNSNTSSSSSSGSSSSRPETPKPIITPMDDKTSGTLNTAINSAVAAVSSSGKGLNVKLKNVSNFTKANAAAIIAKAKSLGKKATVSSDIMSEDGRYVEVRVTLDPALIAKTVRLDGYIRESQTIVTQSRFIKHFENKTAVISLGQEGKFGQTAKIAAKVDLKGFDSANLFLYSYDKKANKYTLITSKDYKIDKNGYLVFNTDLGGDIIVSNGRLVRK